MLVFHFVFVGHFFYDYTWYVDYKTFYEVIGHISRIGFVTLSGLSLYYVSQKSRGFHYFLKRFFVILACALLISAFTFLLIPEYFIFNGILHFFAYATILNYLVVSRFQSNKTLIFALIIFGRLLYLFPSDNIFLNVLGFYPASINTLDFFPLFPWYSYVLLGYLFLPIFMRLTSLETIVKKGNFITFLGSRTLLIYVLHPIVILPFFLYLTRF